jgi:predicted DNA-binding transcriptional regulator AlpA
MRDRDLIEYLRISRRTLAYWRSDPKIDFPRPARIGDRVTLTDAEAVDRWLRERAQ